MSGVEAAAVLGVISSVIAIVDGTKKVYDAASSATGLPMAFREVSTRLPIVKGILESTKQHIDDAHIDTTSYSVIKTLIEVCEDRAKRLKAIFDKVIPGDEDSRLTRYISAAKTLGQGERVETLMQGLMKDVLLLASKHIMELATSQQVVGLTASIKELSAIEPSLPDAALEDTAFTNNNFGNGPMTNNNVMGNQKYQANYGTGKQFQAEEQIFHMENGPVNEQSFHAPVSQYFSSHNALSILYQLEFDDMQERYYDIAEAHQKTFEWIYERTDLKFVQWLQGGSGVYWITGKAGAGKSTLMKLISQDQRTRHYLPADIENVLVSRFFFHDRGQNPLLKSQEGLFRAILHGILSKYPELIAVSLPSRYEKLRRLVQSGQQQSSAPTWSTNELRSVFKAIVSQSQTRLHLCLLIDGLDEFSGHYEDMINTLKYLLPTTANSHVRVQMCLSSRPLEVFEESYSQYTHLRVQDLTADDIKLYVVTKFNDIPRRADLLTEYPTTTDLIIKEIIEKAQGVRIPSRIDTCKINAMKACLDLLVLICQKFKVFLWVTLFVRSLIEGLRNRDDMNTLRRRLSALPAGLKPLYKAMLGKIDPLYHRAAGRTFNMVRLAGRPLSPLAMWFSDHEPYEALSPQSILSNAQIEMRHSDTERQLKARTAGLIEISEVKRDHRRERGINSNESSTQEGVTLPWKQSQIQYLHLTVKEFLLGEDVPTWLANEASASALADTHLIIAACCLRQLRVTKSLELYDYHSMIPRHPVFGDYARTSTEGIIFMIMFHIRQAERATNTSNFSYLKSLDEILTKNSLHEQSPIGHRMTKQRIPHWSSFRYNGWKEPEEWLSDYISYLVTIGMTHSIIDAFKRGYNPASKPGRPLLLYAVFPTAPKVSTGDLETNWPGPAIVKELLKRKCDPNQALRLSDDLGARTVWEALMLHLVGRFSSHWIPASSGSSLYNKELLVEDLSDVRLHWLRIMELFLDHGADHTHLIIRCREAGRAYGWSDVGTHELSVLSLYDSLFVDFNNPLVNTVRASMVEKGAIEFREDNPVETARQYDGGVPDEAVPEEGVRSPTADLSDHTQVVLPDRHGWEGEIPAEKSRLVAFFQMAFTARRSGQNRRPRTKKRDTCVQS